ncbi:nucleoporin-interacting protein NIC96 [Coprinopsis sp. MPI-PUGE-AT-0042]|nr:nucleoporin-interacting protein NIC96 [Coprinopsis sp. MPI-PUGE-AT-0042]
MSAADLSSLLTASKELTSHLSRPDLPSVNLSLDQIEALSRRLVSRQPGTSADADRANYLLAQAHVDVSALSNSIAHLNPATTFSPLQPLQDTDVAGYLRVAHEQNLISTIEEGRKKRRKKRCQRDWDLKKKRVFEELGGKVSGVDNRAVSDLRSSTNQRNNLMASVGPNVSLQMQSKMMAYDRVVTELNSARLRGTSFPIVHSLMEAAQSLATDSRGTQMLLNFHWARVYLGNPESKEAVGLRQQIAKGSREALEEQYWEILEKTVHARPAEARLGGDPSVSNKVRAFVSVRYYRDGEWADRIELIAGTPLWAKLFYLVRTGHAQEALKEAQQYQQALDHREPSFIHFLRTWVESPDRKVPKAQRDNLQASYNAHMLHSSTVDSIEPGRRSVAQLTTTTEDWFLDEEENGGLRGLTEVLLGYGERHFDGPANQPNPKRGVWAGVLLMAVAALWDHPETEIEATSDMTPLSLSPTGPPALSLSTLIWRYVRQFARMDPKEALQYVNCIGSLARPAGWRWKGTDPRLPGRLRGRYCHREQWAGWEELVGGFRSDGSRYSGIIEQGASLLHLHDLKETTTRISEAIKLYNLAGDYSTVVSCLANALGKTVAQTSLDEKGEGNREDCGRDFEAYERSNRAVGKDRDANAGKFDVALEIMESTELIPLAGDIAKTTRRAEEGICQTYLTLTMDTLAGVHQRAKNASMADTTRQDSNEKGPIQTLSNVRKKSRSLMVFAGILKYRMSPDVYSYLARLDVEIAL